MTSTYNKVPLIAILRQLPFQDCWPTAIGEALEKHYKAGRSEAEIIMQSLGKPPYSKENYLQAGRMIVDSKLPEPLPDIREPIKQITDEVKSLFDPREAVKEAYKNN
jgi:hypothetical protein